MKERVCICHPPCECRARLSDRLAEAMIAWGEAMKKNYAKTEVAGGKPL